MLRYHILDVFTDEVFLGNPAGVIAVARFPNDAVMQNIAQEFNVSNTAFVAPINDSEFFIRWFTPHSEAPLCGHATIAASAVLFNNGYGAGGNIIKFQGIKHSFSVEREGDYYTLHFPKFQIGEIDQVRALAISQAVSVTPQELHFSENCALALYSSEEEIYKLEIDLMLLKKVDMRALIVTAKGNKFDFVSRYFAPRAGIDEDPVCASAHCRLIPFWSKRLNKDKMTAWQASSRGGRLECENLAHSVKISGKAVYAMSGDMMINSITSIIN